MRTSAMAMRVAWLCLGVVFIGWLGYRVGFQQIATMLARLRWSVVLVLALYAAHQFARAGALTFCIAPHQALRFPDALSIRLAGEAVEFLTFAGPIASEPAKAKLLGRAGLDLREGLTATLTEYIANMISGMLIAAISMGYILAMLHPSGAVRVVSIAVLVATTSFIAIVSFCARARIGIFRSLAVICPRRQMAILAFEAAAQACLGAELWTLLKALQVSAGIGDALAIEGSMKCLNGAAFFVPGQIGVAEGGYAVIVAIFGLPAAAGVSVALARRIRNGVTAAAGIIALALSQRDLREHCSSSRPRSARTI